MTLHSTARVFISCLEAGLAVFTSDVDRHLILLGPRRQTKRGFQPLKRSITVALLAPSERTESWMHRADLDRNCAAWVLNDARVSQRRQLLAIREEFCVSETSTPDAHRRPIRAISNDRDEAFWSHCHSKGFSEGKAIITAHRLETRGLLFLLDNPRAAPLAVEAGGVRNTKNLNLPFINRTSSILDSPFTTSFLCLRHLQRAHTASH